MFFINYKKNYNKLLDLFIKNNFWVSRLIEVEETHNYEIFDYILDTRHLLCDIMRKVTQREDSPVKCQLF